MLKLLAAALIALVSCNAEAGVRSGKTSPIYPYPGGPQPVRCHYETSLVDQLVEVTYVDACGRIGVYYYWRRVQKLVRVCEPTHRYHILDEE
jgi:hypothetical protein